MAVRAERTREVKKRCLIVGKRGSLQGAARLFDPPKLGLVHALGFPQRSLVLGCAAFNPTLDKARSMKSRSENACGKPTPVCKSSGTY